MCSCSRKEGLAKHGGVLTFGAPNLVDSCPKPQRYRVRKQQFPRGNSKYHCQNKEGRRWTERQTNKTRGPLQTCTRSFRLSSVTLCYKNVHRLEDSLPPVLLLPFFLFFCACLSLCWREVCPPPQALLFLSSSSGKCLLTPNTLVRCPFLHEFPSFSKGPLCPLSLTGPCDFSFIVFASLSIN